MFYYWPFTQEACVKEGKMVTKYKVELDLYRKKQRDGLGTLQSIAHHPLHKLSTQGWIIEQTEFSPLDSVWNLAILCDLCILCVTTDTEKR